MSASRTSRIVRRTHVLHIGLALLAIVCCMILIPAGEARTAYSPEVGFTDPSGRGLHIIPASGGSTAAFPPTLHAVQCNFSGPGTARLSWDAVPGASHYYVSYRNSPIGCNGWPSLNPSNPYECDNHGVTATYADITVAPDHPYEWWAHSVVGGVVSDANGSSFICPYTIPPTCTPSTTCGVTTHADCSQTGTHNPSLPGCNGAFDFSITVSNYALGSPLQVASGAGVGTTQVKKRVDAALLSGTPANVTFTASGVPAGVTYSFAPTACDMTCYSILTLNISSSAQSGAHTITVTGTANGIQRSSTFTLSIACTGSACEQVENECATGWVRVGDTCYFNQCPQGYVRQGDTCVAGCQSGYFYCGAGANAGTLYQRSYTAAPACTARDVVFAACDYGCNASRGACNPTPESGASITANPSLVRQGNTTQVRWQAFSVDSCTIAGGNGQNWSCTGAQCQAGEEVSLPINTQTSFMFTCRVEGQPNIVKNAIVNVVPTFSEE